MGLMVLMVTCNFWARMGEIFGGSQDDPGCFKSVVIFGGRQITGQAIIISHVLFWLILLKPLTGHRMIQRTIGSFWVTGSFCFNPWQEDERPRKTERTIHRSFWIVLGTVIDYKRTSQNEPEWANSFHLLQLWSSTVDRAMARSGSFCFNLWK